MIAWKSRHPVTDTLLYVTINVPQQQQCVETSNLAGSFNECNIVHAPAPSAGDMHMLTEHMGQHNNIVLRGCVLVCSIQIQHRMVGKQTCATQPDIGNYVLWYHTWQIPHKT